MAVKASASITLSRVNDGAAGVGIKSVDVEYYLSTSSTSQTGGSWSTTAPTWVDGKYIWTRTKTVTTDNKTTTTSPVCITGGKGSTGSVGQGVQSITEEYYLSTSKTTQTGGSWVTTPPTWSKGKYMWTRSKIVYKNPTSTSYTTPVCDSSWEAVNELEVGGRNLIVGSGNGGTDYALGHGSMKTDGIFGRGAVHTTEAWNGFYIKMHNIATRNKLKVGDIITISIYVSASSTTEITSPPITLYRHNGTGTAYNFGTKKLKSGSWERLVFTFKITSSEFLNTVRFEADVNTSYDMLWSCPQIEIGNKATDWTPAPEDLEKRVASAEQKIEPGKITATVEEHINKNGSTIVATKSYVTQEADKIVHKFTSGGGYNLLENSDAKNGQYMWTGNGATLTIGTSGATPFFGGNEFKSTFPNGLKYGKSIKLKANTDYVYEGWIYCDMSFKGSSVSPLHYWCMNTPNTSGQAQLEVLDYRQDVTANVFNKCYVHFRTKSGDVYFTPFVYGGPEGEMVAVRQLSLTEGKVETAWTPHPSEIYEGSTVIDASGVTVNNGALRVKDGSGNIMLEGDSTGSLYLRKRLNVGNTARIDATSGIEVVGGKLVISPANFDKTSEQIVLHETGVFFGYNVFGVGSFDCMVGFNSQDVAHGKPAGVFRFKGNTLGYEFDNFISAPSFRATTGGYMLKANQSIAWECEGDESRIFTESSDNVTKLVLQTGDDGAQDCVQIRSNHWNEGVSTIAQFDRNNVWLYKDCRTDRVAGRGSMYRVYVGEGNSRIDATSDCYCRLYTAQWSNGAADTGLYLSPYGGVAVKVGGVSKHDLMANGNKLGGSIEIEGMTYGMSPIDSPRSMIEDIYFDYELSEGLNTIEINDILAKSLDKYAIFPSSNLVEVVEKTKYYFVVKADKACISDIRITGTRIDVKNQYYEIMGGITHGSEERVSY